MQHAFQGQGELQLWDDDEGLRMTFDEIETLARNCRYRDCRHHGEPGCAVLEAVNAGALGADRSSSLHKLQRELAWLDRREDPANLTEKLRRYLRRWFSEGNCWTADLDESAVGY